MEDNDEKVESKSTFKVLYWHQDTLPFEALRMFAITVKMGLDGYGYSGEDFDLLNIGWEEVEGVHELRAMQDI